MTPENLINELEKYCFNLKEIMGRFVPGHNSHRIRSEDDPHFRTFVIEIIDLLNDSIGKNQYSPRINQIFLEGISNFYESPSYKSVQDIVSVLASVITRLKRNPELCNPQKENAATENKTIEKTIEYPEKITLKWLHAHVPYRFWLIFIGLLITAFTFGATFTTTKLYKSFIALITPNNNTTNINPKNIK